MRDVTSVTSDDRGDTAACSAQSFLINDSMLRLVLVCGGARVALRTTTVGCARARLHQTHADRSSRLVAGIDRWIGLVECCHVPALRSNIPLVQPTGRSDNVATDLRAHVQLDSPYGPELTRGDERLSDFLEGAVMTLAGGGYQGVVHRQVQAVSCEHVSAAQRSRVLRLYCATFAQRHPTQLVVPVYINGSEVLLADADVEMVLASVLTDVVQRWASRTHGAPGGVPLCLSDDDRRALESPPGTLAQKDPVLRAHGIHVLVVLDEMDGLLSLTRGSGGEKEEPSVQSVWALLRRQAAHKDGVYTTLLSKESGPLPVNL